MTLRSHYVTNIPASCCNSEILPSCCQNIILTNILSSRMFGINNFQILRKIKNTREFRHFWWIKQCQQQIKMPTMYFIACTDWMTYLKWTTSMEDAIASPFRTKFGEIVLSTRKNNSLQCRIFVFKDMVLLWPLFSQQWSNTIYTYNI